MLPEISRLLSYFWTVSQQAHIQSVHAVGTAAALVDAVVLGSGPTRMNVPPRGFPISNVSANALILKLFTGVVEFTNV